MEINEDELQSPGTAKDAKTIDEPIPGPSRVHRYTPENYYLETSFNEDEPVTTLQRRQDVGNPGRF